MADIRLPHDHGEHLEKITASLPGATDCQTVAELLKQMSDGTRLRIFWLLCHCEECVINISAVMNMSSPAVSHHLKQLKAAGLISSERIGKEVYYQAAETETAQLLHHAMENILQLTCPSAGIEPLAHHHKDSE